MPRVLELEGIMSRVNAPADLLGWWVPSWSPATGGLAGMSVWEMPATHPEPQVPPRVRRLLFHASTLSKMDVYCSLFPGAFAGSGC